MLWVVTQNQVWTPSVRKELLGLAPPGTSPVGMKWSQESWESLPLPASWQSLMLPLGQVGCLSAAHSGRILGATLQARDMERLELPRVPDLLG